MPKSEHISIPINIDWDTREVVAGLNMMRKRGADLRPWSRKLKKPFRRSLIDAARAGQSPTGEHWRKRSARTADRDRRGKSVVVKKPGKGRSGPVRRRIQKRRKKTRILGRLPTMLRMQSQRLSFVAVNRVQWAIAHHEGGRVGRGSVLPPRPFMEFSNKFLDLSDKILMAHVFEKAWNSNSGRFASRSMR